MNGLSTAAKVGLITILSLLALACIIIWKTDIFLVNRGYQMKGSFQNIEGLTIGSEVRYRGFRAGKIMKIDPGPLEIILEAVIDRNIKVPIDSDLRIAYDGLVGQKYLEIKPGTSEVLYQPGQLLYGVRTSGIVDFVDIAAKNLMETKAILESVRKIVENPALQRAITNLPVEASDLVEELRQTNAGIKAIIADPKFQNNVKGTIAETNKTLSSANHFFEGFSKINLRASGGVDVGSRANAVRGDVDVIQSEKTYYRFGFGEGPTRTMGLLDFLVTNKATETTGYRLGVINNQLGGGLFWNTSKNGNIIADIYDINNIRPNWPKVRLGYEHQVQDYADVLLQADDVLNGQTSNIMLGIRVKPFDEKLFY